MEKDYYLATWPETTDLWSFNAIKQIRVNNGNYLYYGGSSWKSNNVFSSEQVSWIKIIYKITFIAPDNTDAILTVDGKNISIKSNKSYSLVKSGLTIPSSTDLQKTLLKFRISSKDSPNTYIEQGLRLRRKNYSATPGYFQRYSNNGAETNVYKLNGSYINLTFDIQTYN